ncbi:hypothetical protein BASA83_005780 [Batrachochytrium salamandrivorans]|nr:hypothetical protein BASA83_005780 [Batrachochytrium salamandrivorans]
MQFFCLLSFVVVALHAAALPQPARPSKKCSNSVSADLVSDLKAISNRPALNSQQDPVTLISLERRDDSKGRSGDNSKSDPSPPPALTPGGIIREINGIFRATIGPLDLSATIDEIGDYHGHLPKSMEEVGKAIGGIVGGLMMRYFEKMIYINGILKDWMATNGDAVIPILKSGFSDDEYSRVELSLRKTVAKLMDEVRECLIAVFDAISRIIEKTGDVAQNVETATTSFERVFNSRMKFFEELKLLLKRFAAGKSFYTILSNIGASINKFMGKQKRFSNISIKELRTSPSS